VSVRDRGLRVVTKAGYFAPDSHAPADPRQQTLIKLAEAAQSTIPFTALDVELSGLVRHPENRTAEFTVQLKSKNLSWLPADGGRDASHLVLEAASLNGDRQVLASKIEKVTLMTSTADLSRLPNTASRFDVTIRLPRKTRNVRVVMENEDGGRIGAAELDRKAIDAAPAIPTSAPEAVPPGTDPKHPVSPPAP